MVIRTSGNLLNSLSFFITLLIKANPLAFPPIDPSPMREKIWYSSKLALSNFAITPSPSPGGNLRSLYKETCASRPLFEIFLIEVFEHLGYRKESSGI